MDSLTASQQTRREIRKAFIGVCGNLVAVVVAPLPYIVWFWHMPPSCRHRAATTVARAKPSKINQVTVEKATAELVARKGISCTAQPHAE